MRILRPLPVLLCCTGVALAGCGGSSLLDGSSADDLQASIARVKAAVADGRCDEATTAVKQGLQRVDALPSSVDRKLVARLREGFRELENQIPLDCEAPVTTATDTTPTETTDTTPTETTDTTPTETTDTTPPPDTTTDTTPTDTTPTTEPDDTTGDGDSGGTPADPGGVDGPSATPRALRELQGAGRDARKRLERALRDARKALRGDQ